MLNVSNLTKIYEQGDEKIVAVNDCSLKLEDGELAALVGTSGSGKSTLLKMCGGMLRPSSGYVFVNNKDIYRIPDAEASAIRRKYIGFVFQQFNLLPFLTVKENIILPSLAEKNSFDRKYFDSIVETLKLSSRLTHYPAQISGGEQQRVAIARALINKPKLILADEPTGNLDKHNAEVLMSLLIESMKKYGQTLFLITHDSNIASYAKNIYRMEDGHLYDE